MHGHRRSLVTLRRRSRASRRRPHHCLLHQQNTPKTKPNNEYSRRFRGGRPRRVLGRTNHNAHIHTRHHTRVLYHGVSAGNTTAAGAQRRGQAGACTYMSSLHGHNTYQHHRLDSSRESTVCTGRDRAPAVRLSSHAVLWVSSWWYCLLGRQCVDF